MARELLPGAITLNMLTPGKGGWEALWKLKADVRTADIPIIIVSVVDKKGIGFCLGAAEYLVKPVSREALLGAVRRQLPPDSGKHRILIVDDDPQAVQMSKEVLASAGYDTVAAYDGAQALSLLQDVSPHAILLDLLMPGMDGFEVIRRIKEEPCWRDLPVFVLTAKDLSADDLQLLAKHTHALFQKGAAWRHELLAQVRRAVEAGQIAEPA